ncbi:hypothetical protein LSTR_LSTR012697 [Laodelphax striatellus]|uniref:Coiled-coil domain-containing protein 93 n=1 Tax=Laodelphax striatellus TaxID=195883 RepID=A0A482XB17_LAOST|nr:hypothetical protein LSTR_LSTR012697 [Laodelphax striatellus]
MAFSEAFKPKGSKHLSIIVDADGKEVQVEAREDVEQKVKLEEIINILYAAGYFRARIKGISAFDKIIIKKERKEGEICVSQIFNQLQKVVGIEEQYRNVSCWRKKHSIEDETQKLEEQLNEANSRLEKSQMANSEDKLASEVLRKLQKLVTANENLKQQELAFREQCKAELASLQNAIREVEEVEGDTDQERAGERQAIDQLLERVTVARLAVGKRTRAVAALQRQLDQVPSRTELAQYQRRFMELYALVAAKHGETKKFYTLYNCLNDKHNYLKKELNILNSIQDSYTEAMASPAAMEQFMTQFESILHGIQQNKRKVEQKLNDEKRQRDQLSTRLLALIELQRQIRKK